MKKLLSGLIILLMLSGCSSVEQQSNEAEQLTQSLDQLVTLVDEASEPTLDDIVPSNSEKDVQTHANNTTNEDKSNTITEPEDYDYVLIFPSEQYPETALHIYGAVEQGYSDVCTIDREGAEENRKASLKGIPTMDGYDRDEWPMAMCEEGGKGASVAYISASDNRGAGSWVGHELSQYENGERVLFIVEKPTKLFPTETETQTETETKALNSSDINDNIVYNSCAEVKAANAAPIKKGEPGYSKKLDRDGDGIACEL